MKRSKGFTLIELLTVIAILAIILIIAIPSILNVLEKSKKQAFIESGISIVKSLSTSSSVDEILNGKITFPEEGKSKSVSLDEINYENASDITGNIVITNDKGTYRYYLYIANKDYIICNKEYNSVSTNDVEKGNTCGDSLLYPVIENKYKEQTYNYKTEITEELILNGVSASDTRDGVITNKITYTSNVNTNVLGTYEIIYRVENTLGNSIESKRTIYVKDIESPIVINNIETESINKGENYNNYLNGVEATDNYDSNIEITYICKNGLLEKIECSSMTSKAGIYYIVYDAKDSSDNKYSETSNKEVKRVITVKDIEGPVITLIGDNPIYIEVGSTLTEPGYEAIDDEDGDITEKVTTTTNLNTKVVGEYEVEYYVEDKAGNIGSNVRRIIVRDTTIPTITSISGNPTSWETSATLVVNASDNYKLHETAYSFDNGATWQVSNNKTFTSNGTINIKVRDESGNESTTTIVNIEKIDSTVPTISINSGTKVIDEDTNATDNVYTMVVGPSGGTVSCINNTTGGAVTTYDTLNLGLNNVTCTVTNGLGKVVSATGNIVMNQFFMSQSANKSSSYALSGTVTMSNGDIQYGPYKPTVKGKYKITYVGQGFGDGKQTLQSYQHRDPSIAFTILNISYSNSNIVYYIDVTENLWGLEVRLNALSDISIEKIKIEYVGEVTKYVSDGLLVHYDGYSRPTSNVWNDLSGKGNNGILYNFSSLDGSEYNSVYFNGSDYIYGVNNNPLYSESNKLPDMTVEIIFKKTISSWGNVLSFNQFVNQSNSYMDLWTTVSEDSRGYQVGYGYDTDSTVHSYILGWNSYPLGSIIKISYSKKGNIYKTYINGKEVDSQVLDDMQGFNINSFKLGVAENGYNFTGHIYSVRIYNRALTATEISNNNTIDKYRFGL